ncbi:MAG: hypothetical protein IIB83_04120 [Bacteroidetes bacterium]|nr:hypothetical protein [Bacteroidota bacterium]
MDSDPGQPAFEPPVGTTFRAVEIPGLQLAAILCEVASFLQTADAYVKLRRYADWYEHDGLHFDLGDITFSEFFDIVGSPKALLESSPDDDCVYVGIADDQGRWYLRYRLDWDVEGRTLKGDFALTLVPELLDSFRQGHDRQGLIAESSSTYFDRIRI